MTTRRQREINRRTRLKARHERLVSRDMVKALSDFAFTVSERPGDLKKISKAFEPVIAAALVRRLKVISFTFGNEQIAVINRPKAAEQLLEGKDVQGVFESEIAQWLRKHAAKAAKSIARTFQKTLAAIIADAHNDGVNERETGKRIRDRAPAITKVQAERIARTETHSASERGSYNAAKASGLDMVKEWASAEDKRVRQSHAMIDGTITEMNEYFSVGESKMLYPGDQAGEVKEIVNCRCIGLYHPRIDGEILR